MVGAALALAGMVVACSGEDAAGPAAGSRAPASVSNLEDVTGGSTTGSSSGTPSAPTGSEAPGTTPGTSSAPRTPPTAIAPVASAVYPPPLAGCSAVTWSAAAAGRSWPALPAATRAAVDAAVAELQAAGQTVAVSVWVDGYGEVVADDQDEQLIPASNEKLLVAYAALALLPTDAPLTTRVVATQAPGADGVIDGDLVIIGGGDPMLTTTGPHSVATLAAAIQAAGIREVRGDLVVDESRYDAVRSAPGWPAGGVETTVGSLSAMAVDRNRVGADARVVSDPALVAGRIARNALTVAGVNVTGEVRTGTTTTGIEITALPSPDLREIVHSMLSDSNNFAAELLTKELGVRTSGQGTTAAGLAAVDRVLGDQCGLGGGTGVDGSGLSAGNRRSAAQLRRILQSAAGQRWSSSYHDGLAVAGRSGTLATRLVGSATAGRVFAKTGSVATARALSGYLTTTTRHEVTFSILITGARSDFQTRMDAFVTTLATTL